MPKKTTSRINGLKGGRPKSNADSKIDLPEIHFVILTPTQYDSLLEKYGFELLRKGLKILDNWLGSGSPASHKYVGKNNYAHFRSDGWVINTAKLGKF